MTKTGQNWHKKGQKYIKNKNKLTKIDLNWPIISLSIQFFINFEHS